MNAVCFISLQLISLVITECSNNLLYRIAAYLSRHQRTYKRTQLASSHCSWSLWSLTDVQMKEWMKLCIWRKKTSTQNLVCSQRQIHTVHTCRLSQAKNYCGLLHLIAADLSRHHWTCAITYSQGSTRNPTVFCCLAGTHQSFAVLHESTSLLLSCTNSQVFCSLAGIHHFFHFFPLSCNAALTCQTNTATTLRAFRQQCYWRRDRLRLGV